MKGKCIGGPLDGQEREADGMYLFTTVFTPAKLTDEDRRERLSPMAGTVQTGVYECMVGCDEAGLLINVWQYVGVR